MHASSFDHLLKNLGRLDLDKLFYANSSSENLFPGFNKGNYSAWLDQAISPNTRLVIEPKIDGCSIALLYENGCLKKAIAADGTNKTNQLYECKHLPKNIPFKRKVAIQGLIYARGLAAGVSRRSSCSFLNGKSTSGLDIHFVGLQIFDVDLNHYSQLQELSKLGFEIPPNEFTRRNSSEARLYIDLWKAKKLFYEIPSTGVILKVNSRKLQRQLGENNFFLNWGYLVDEEDKQIINSNTVP